MKKLTKVFTMLLMIFIVSSCKKNEELATQSVTSIKLLHKDARLTNIISMNNFIESSVKNRELAIKLLNKGILSSFELKELSLALGFRNEIEYQNFLFQYSNLSNSLSIDYNLKNVDKSQIRDEVFKSIDSSNFQVKLFSCESDRFNCLTEVAAESFFMHVGCGALDVTIIAGAICHSLAVAYQLAAGASCNSDAQKCRTEAQVH